MNAIKPTNQANAFELDILTLFPSMFAGVLQESILSRAIEKGLLRVFLHQVRDFTTDKHRTVDDLPYGGGPGMVMKCEPLYAAWKHAKERNPALPARTVLLSPQGVPLQQAWLQQKAETRERLILVCGRYEGIDERFIESCVDEELSLGDFVLSGGEIAAMAVVDGLMRLLPGALGNEESSKSESFSQGLLEYPQYTRPPEVLGRKVPEVLLSGDHARIAKWRQSQSLERTQRKRPDLLTREKG